MAAIVPYIAAVLLLAMGGYLLFKLIKKTRLITASKTWPAVTAQVLKKEVVRHVSSKGQVSYYPEVDYKYSIMGTEVNKHTRLSGMWSRNSAQKTLDEMGETLEVRYNPENPTEHAHAYDKVKITDYLVIVAALGLGMVVMITQLL
jgi:hypothetical protein